MNRAATASDKGVAAQNTALGDGVGSLPRREVGRRTEHGSRRSALKLSGDVGGQGALVVEVATQRKAGLAQGGSEGLGRRSPQAHGLQRRRVGEHLGRRPQAEHASLGQHEDAGA